MDSLRNRKNKKKKEEQISKEDRKKEIKKNKAKKTSLFNLCIIIAIGINIIIFIVVICFYNSIYEFDSFEIRIQKKKSEIWRVVKNLENYPKWNSLYKNIYIKKLKAGHVFLTELIVSNQIIQQSMKILEIQENKKICWGPYPMKWLRKPFRKIIDLFFISKKCIEIIDEDIDNDIYRISNKEIMGSVFGKLVDLIFRKTTIDNLNYFQKELYKVLNEVQ